MDVEKLRSIIKSKGMYQKENAKNIICNCPYCGDHPNPRKKGHMYVSVKPDYPVVHCFLCNKTFSLPKFIFDITADKKISFEIISREELDAASVKQRKHKVPDKLNTTVFKIPEIGENSFQAKQKYIHGRSNNIHHAQHFDNLIFDFNNFFAENNLTEKVDKMIGKFGIERLQDSFVGFLTKNHSMLTCRNINPKSEFKFRKLVLQPPRFNLLDYVEFAGGDPDSKLVVLTEGVFDAIGEMSVNSLGIFDKARCYVAGLSYSYSTLLKSVCFDHQLFDVDVVILSDRDVHPGTYYKLRNMSQHILGDMKIYYNRNRGGDFGSFPIQPFEMQLEPPRRRIKYDNNRRRRTNYN
jgi:hypothetical protein